MYHFDCYCQFLTSAAMNITAFLTIILLLGIVNCQLGIDFSTLQPLTFFQCIKDAGYSFVIPRAFHSYGSIDLNAVPNLKNAKSVGLKTDIYMFPCRGKSASAQVDELIEKIPADLYETVWVDVETNPSSGCSWGTDYAANCDYLVEVLNRLNYYKKKVGIYTVTVFWDRILGGRLACPKAASVMLWYARYDNLPQFTDYTQISAWITPAMKQYSGDVTVCGVDTDKNFRP